MALTVAQAARVLTLWNYKQRLMEEYEQLKEVDDGRLSIGAAGRHLMFGRHDIASQMELVAFG